LASKVFKYIKASIPYLILIAITTPIVLMYTMLFLGSVSRSLYGLIPTEIRFDNWEFLLSGYIQAPGTLGLEAGRYPNIYTVTFNTFLLAISVAALEVFITSLAGYAISRYNFKGRSAFLTLTLILHSFPSVTLLIAIFYILNIIGLFDTLLGVILVKVSLELPLGIWIMKGFFDGIPWDVEMSALVDGCSRLEAWWKVIMPNVKGGISSVMIFAFLSGWSEFLFILTFIVSTTNWTLSMLVNALIGEWRFVDYGKLAAVSIYYMIPIVIFFLFFQKYLLRITIASKGAV